jgi:hypothetical protein
VLVSDCLGQQASLHNTKSLLNHYQDTVWILGGDKVLDDHFRKWKLDLVLDARNTLVGQTSARLGGIRVGLEYRRVHRFGIGFYSLGDGVEVESLDDFDSRVTSGNVSLGYSSIFYERVIYFSPKWEVSAAAHSGIGTVSGVVRLEGESSEYTWKKTVRPVELSSSGYYNFTYWLSAGGGLGYRIIRNTPEEIRDVYNGPVLIAKVKIRFGKLVRSIWNKEVRYEY